MKRVCKKCGFIKSLTDFCKDSLLKEGRTYCCKVCRNKHVRIWFNTKYQTDEQFRKKIQIYSCQRTKKKYHEKPRFFLDKIKTRLKNLKSENPQKYQQICKVNYLSKKNWRKNHPNEDRLLAKRSRNKRRSTVEGRLNHSFSTRVRYSLKNNKKNLGWETIVGYTVNDLRNHLENQFRDNMSWGNYGKWHIDHIIPVAFFRFKKPEDVEFKMCWRLENLQPLWATENEQKSNKIQKISV